MQGIPADDFTLLIYVKKKTFGFLVKVSFVSDICHNINN